MSNPFTVGSQDEKFAFSSRLDYDTIDRPSKWDFDETDGKGNPMVTKVRRILDGPVAVSFIYVPVVMEDKETHEIKHVKYPISLPRDEDGSFIIPHALKCADQADSIIKMELGYDMSKCDHPFRPSTTFRYVVMVKDSDLPEDYVVTIGEYGISIKDGLSAIQRKEHPKKTIATKAGDVPVLVDGPNILYDVFLEKKHDKQKNKNPRFGMVYAVTADPDNTWRVRVPKTVYDTGFGEFDFVANGVFTETEWKKQQEFLTANGVSTFRAYLEKLSKDSEINDQLVYDIMTKLDAKAKDRDGTPIFPDPEKFVQKFTELFGTKLIGGAMKQSASAPVIDPTVSIPVESAPAIVEAAPEQPAAEQANPFSAPKETTAQEPPTNPFGAAKEAEPKEADAPETSQFEWS